MNVPSTSSSIVVDTSSSPFARLRSVPVSAIRLCDSFWEPIFNRLVTVTLPTQYQQMEITGRIQNFRRAAGQYGGEFVGLYFNESDVYKWIEATAFALSQTPSASLQENLNEVIDVVQKTQQADGYLNAYFVRNLSSKRFSDLKDQHELYCAGHLFNSAIMLSRCLGDDRLLHASQRYADLLVEVFGDGGSLQSVYDGHPGIKMALVELYRATGKRSYLDLAASFLDRRGAGLLDGMEYYQDHLPFRELRRMAGHAVRAVYLNAGAADIYSEIGDPSILHALTAMWEHMRQCQEYVTGGIGSRRQGEAFGDDYELPNQSAYAETCAAIGKIFWAWRMLNITGDSRYTDALEATLYNAALVGIGLDGASYSYDNPLACESMHRRQPWFAISCCPPNIARLIASLPGYFYSTSDQSVWVHLYASSICELRMSDGSMVKLQQETEYPWSGQVRLRVLSGGDFNLRLRVPGWCEGDFTLAINGQPVAPIDRQALKNGNYLQVQRHWQEGDEVLLDLAMPVQRICASPEVIENIGKIALSRGPLVYCFEQIDHPGEELQKVLLPDSAELVVGELENLPGGVCEIKSIGKRMQNRSKEGPLYQTTTTIGARYQQFKEVELTAIPYFAWGNRDYGDMVVWMKRG